MKMPPVLLALDGVNGLSVQDLPLHLDRFTLRKIMGQVDGKQDAAHQLTLDQAKQLFGEITNPVMVLKSDTTGGLVIVTAMKNSNNAPVIAAIHLSKKKGRYVINEIASVYGKDNFETWIKNQAKNNNIVYLNQEKSQAFARSSSHQLRGAVQNILTSYKSPDLVRQSPLQLRGVVHQNKALDGSSTATLPHFLGRLETAHVGVVGTRTSTQTILSPDDIVKSFEQSDTQHSRGQSENKKAISKTETTTQHVREALVKRFGEATISKLEKVGVLNIVDTTPKHIKETGIEGFYENGQVTLIADNLTEDAIIPTFLHELGGHGGFQNMMKPEQYADLMRQFERTVEQGNPIALEAKKLAEREKDPNVQQLEYLPYLLTLASNTQVKHAVHKGNVTRLIADLISKVKAWIYDRLGVNLNLNPDDMVALAERMVDKAATNVAVNRHGHTQYSLNENSQDFTQVGEQIKKLFHQAVNGDLTGKPVSIGRLSQQGRDYLQQISGLSLKPQIDFVLNPSDLVHIHKDHYGTNEKDKGNNIPLNDDDIAKMASVIYQPDHVVFLGYDERTKSNKFSFLKSSENGTYNLVEVYGDKRGNLTAKTFFKTKRGVTQRVMDLEKSLLPTSETYFGTTPKGNVPTLFNGVNSVAGSNDGTENNQPLYSRQSMQDTIDRLGQNIRDLSVQSVRDKAGFKWTDWLGVGLQFLGRRQLTEIYAKLLPQLDKYDALAAQMDADKNDAGAEADNIVREWGNLRDEEALANLMHDATLAKIDLVAQLQSGQGQQPTQQMIEDLRKNPNLINDFEKWFGKGSAAKYLNG